MKFKQRNSRICMLENLPIREVQTCSSSPLGFAVGIANLSLRGCEISRWVGNFALQIEIV